MIKTYEAIFDEEHNTGVYGISLVHNPAMEGLFIALNKDEKIQFKEVSKEERKVVGLVLEPNKPIYRNNQGEEYNIVFSEQTIKNLSYNFFKQNFQKNSTIEHDAEQKIENVTFVESWIVEDQKNDKQNVYGFNYPVGSWLAVLKIDNNDVWENYVKTGQVQGFSIDGLLSLKEINLNSNINMSEISKEIEKQTSILTELTNSIKKLFVKEEKIELGSVKTADGSLTIEYDGEELKAGINAWVTAEDGTKVPLPVGEHPIEGGSVIVVTEEGVISEVKNAEAEPAPQGEKMNNEASNDAKAVEEITNMIKSILIKYEAQESEVKELKTALSGIKKENEEMRVLMSETPAKKPIKGNTAQVELSKLTLQERINLKLKN